MTTFKSLILAIVVALNFTLWPVSNTSASPLSISASAQKLINYEEYVYIKDILYHIVYDDDGYIIIMEPVGD